MTASNPLVQTTEGPLSTLEQANDFLDLVRNDVVWTCAGVIYDNGPNAILFVLLVNDSVVSVFRCSLALDDTVSVATSMLGSNADEFIIASTPGVSFTYDDVRSLEKLNSYWRIAQSVRLQIANFNDFFKTLHDDILSKGRGANILTDTRNQVLLDSHGRCMFEGCSVDLTRDPITGKTGNYKTLAHNVASSEQGARGVLYLSNELSNDPNNILVLCDIHHRLVDSVAKTDFPAHVISAMRDHFCDQTTRLLDSMRYEPMPAICVCWPVREDQFSLPNAQQIAASLKPLKARWSGELLPIVEKDESLRSIAQEDRWRILPAAINGAATKVEALASSKNYRAALFATGTMPALVALGARIGNKSNIIPMLKHREGGKWFWPSDSPIDDCSNIVGVSELSDSEQEVTIMLALTALPKGMQRAASDLGHKILTIKPEGELCNSALGHPVDALAFRQRIQELLHALKDKHGVHTAHLLPCASNAACVCFGQAIDNYHPDILLYDFTEEAKSMETRIMISTAGNKCEILSTADHKKGVKVGD